MIDRTTLASKITAVKRDLGEDPGNYKLAEYLRLLFTGEALMLSRKAKVRNEDPQHQAGATAMQSQILRIFERSGK